MKVEVVSVSKKKVCVLYENRVRNDGAPLYAWNVLKGMEGVEATHLLPQPDVKDFGKFDLYLWVDHGEDALGLAHYKCPNPSAYWTSDTHLGYDFRLAKAREFDHVFCMQKRAVEEFKRDGIANPYWLPHAVEPIAYRKGVWDGQKWMDAAPLKRYDVAFVGHINGEKRINFLDRAFKEFPNFFYGQRFFEEAASVYNEARICLNISAVDDVNMRTFEVMASGGFLLTEDIPTLHELFEDGKHLVMYKDLDDMVAKARYYIDNPEEREKIAQAGREEVLAKHTYTHRMKEMLGLLGLTAKEKETCAAR